LAYIQVIQGPDNGRTFELIDGENIIGRQSPTVGLTDGTISRQHARVITRNGKWVLEDCGSANGTFLNGVRVSKSMPLKRGDQIRCGASLLVFGGSEKTMPTGAAVDIDEEGMLVDAAIVATVPSNEDSVIIPTAEAGTAAIQRLRILYDLISDVGSILNVDLLLQRTLHKMLEVIKADRAYIMLVDEKDKLTLKASYPEQPEAMRHIPVSRTLLKEVLRNEVGVLSSNAMSDKRFASGKSVHDLGIRSALCVPIKARGKIIGIINVDCNVSEQTYSTEQLRLLTAIGYQTGLAIESVKLYDAAVQSERLAAVGETVANLSHHIKNILQALGGGIDIVEMSLNSNDVNKAQDAWPIVQRNLGKINALILNMLAFSKDRQPLLESVNINHVLNECLELVTPQADEREVAIISDLDELPPIPVDAAGLQQGFLNLLTNALEAVEDQNGVITLTSKFDSMNRLVVVTVSDNGSGIESDKLEEIFHPFFSSKGQKGTGLGLAVTKKVVNEHNGSIKVESKPGQGTTFTIKLPAITGQSAADTDSAKMQTDV